MRCFLTLLCLMAIVAPSFSHDDSQSFRKRARLSRRRPGIRINAEVVGRRGGVLKGQLNSGIRSGISAFGKELRRNTEGYIGGILPSGVGAEIGGRLRGGSTIGRGGLSLGHSGAIAGGIRGLFGGRAKGSISGNVRAGVHAPVLPVVGGGYVAGGAAVIPGNSCGYLPPSCRADPREFNTICRYSFSPKYGHCVEETVFTSCIARGPRNNLFNTMRECDMYCS